MNRLFFENRLIKKCIVFALTILMLLATLIASTISANADSGMAYELVKYENNTVVFDDHSYKVEVDITVKLPDDIDELEIALPSGNYQIEDVQVEGTSSSVSSSSTGRSLTINDRAKLKKGQHTFKITYTIREYAERADTYDIFYYDALLPEWKVPIGEMVINVKFPRDFPWDDIKYYAGQFGVASNSTKLNYKADEASRTVTITGNKIPENFSVTLKAQLPNGYWKDALDHTWAGYLIAGLLIVVLIISLILWLIGGRDPKVKKTKEMYPIEGVLPSDITYIYEGKVKARDLISMIIYMGIKGYLRISEYAPKKYRLYRENEPKGEERFIRNIYNTLFEGIYEGRSIDMDELGPRLRRAIKQATYDVEAGYTDKDMASKTTRSRVFRMICIVLTSVSIAAIPILADIYQYIKIRYTLPILFGLLAAAMLVSVCRRVDSKYDVDDVHYYTGLGVSLIGYALAVGLPLYSFVRESGMYMVGLAALLLAFANVFFCAVMPARGKGNAELTMRLNQLRKFIYRTKWTEIEDIYRKNPEYYYDMIPYALIFSGLETWAKTFSYLDVEEPVWFSDDVVGHAESRLRETPTTVDYAKDIRAFARTMEDSYNAMMLRRHRGQRKR